jgi:hypothetical protein
VCLSLSQKDEVASQSHSGRKRQRRVPQKPWSWCLPYFSPPHTLRGWTCQSTLTPWEDISGQITRVSEALSRAWCHQSAPRSQSIYDPQQSLAHGRREEGQCSQPHVTEEGLRCVIHLRACEFGKAMSICNIGAVLPTFWGVLGTHWTQPVSLCLDHLAPRPE